MKVVDQVPIKFISHYWNSKFGHRVQKITIDAGMTCPNRDGRAGWGGCTFCDNKSFSPALKNRNMPIQEQLQQGKENLNKRYHCQQFLAYFQSYSNTYAPLEVLKQYYEEALSVEGIIGLVIGTRPDCFGEGVIDYLAHLSEEVEIVVELGLESFNDQTLKAINRGHGVDIFLQTVEKLAKANIKIGTHLIFGLPGDQNENVANWAQQLSHLPIHSVKIHQLQLIKDTKMSLDYAKNPFPLLKKEEYQKLLITFLKNLSPHIYIDRLIAQSPLHLLHFWEQDWKINSGQFKDEVIALMKIHNLKQGELCST